MASPTTAHDEFNHQVAIKLSRALNTLNPNDLLAQRVISIAEETSSVDSFISGIIIPFNSVNSQAKRPFAAANTFGKFQDSFLTELHAAILSHAKQEATGVIPHPIQGITVLDSDVLEPEPPRPGGLQRPDTVRRHVFLLNLTERLYQRHTFRLPAKPLEPPTPRTSLLGLDTLAKEKRAAVAHESVNGNGSRKRPRLDDSDEPFFKGRRQT